MRTFALPRRIALALLCSACARSRMAPDPRVSAPTDALSDIVGVWQSDTTDGVSARSSCAWTPLHLAVVCDQRISFTNAPEREVTNVFAHGSARRFVFYGMPQPGETLSPVPLSIAAHVWIYGGVTRDGTGALQRTVNDFSERDAYTWRAETSTDGEHWRVLAHGRSTRVRS